MEKCKFEFVITGITEEQADQIMQMIMQFGQAFGGDVSGGFSAAEGSDVQDQDVE